MMRLTGPRQRGEATLLASAWGARLCGIAQVLLGCCLIPQLSESTVTKFLLHALP